MKMSGNTFLITGGGSGIGEALAHRFHDLGNNVIIAGRQRASLEKAITGRPRMHARVVDIDDPHGIKSFAERMVAEFPSINVLVNNAGIVRFEAVQHSRDLGDAAATVTTNLLGPIRVIDAFIDHLSTSPDAAIINGSSGLAFVPIITAPTYAATKAAIHCYTVALREALKGKIEVIELIPPRLRTELTPGQAAQPGALPLAAFIDEAMTLFQQQPTPAEILVQRVLFQLKAESEHRFDQAVTTLNDAARQQRAGQ